jgi:hypothetical protein
MGGAQIPKQDDQQQLTDIPAREIQITPLQRGGILGVMDHLADAMVGKTRPELAKDQDGTLYVKNSMYGAPGGPTRGQQWLRIAAEGIQGAAAGMAAGKGEGNQGKAAFAGVQQGQQMAAQQEQNAKDMTDEVRQQKLDNANNQMLQMKMAENAWDFADKKRKATEDDVKFTNEMEDRLIKDGGKVIGTAAHPGDIAEILKVQPDVMEQMVKKQTIRILPNIDENGNHVGIKAIIMPSGYHNEVLSAGQTGHSFNPITGKVEEFKYSDPVTAGERDVHDAAAVTAKQAFDEKQRQADKAAADLAHTKQETATSAAEQTEIPSKIAEQTANANKANSETAAAKDKGGAGAPGTDDDLIRMVGSGPMPVGNWGYMLSRMKDPTFARKVAAAYPDMDTTTIKRYMDASDEFASSTKGAGKQLNNGSTAIGHLGELYDRASASSMIPYTEDSNRTNTLKAGIVGELGQFYGESTIPGQAKFEKAVGSNVPSARKDGIIEQIQMLGDKMSSFQQQWKNSMPSKHYSRPMPGLSPEAMSTWMKLDPTGARRFLAHQDELDMSKNGSQPAAQAAPKAAPGGLSFSKSAYLKANPQGNVNAAAQAAAAAGHPVVD